MDSIQLQPHMCNIPLITRKRYKITLSKLAIFLASSVKKKKKNRVGDGGGGWKSVGRFKYPLKI